MEEAQQRRTCVAEDLLTHRGNTRGLVSAQDKNGEPFIDPNFGKGLLHRLYWPCSSLTFDCNIPLTHSARESGAKGF